MTSRRARYLHDVHIVLVVVLILICVATGFAAWRLHPASNGFQNVPQGLRIVTSGSQYDLTETLTPTGDGGATLQVDEPTSTGDGKPLVATGWTAGGQYGGAMMEGSGPMAKLDGAPIRNRSWTYIVVNPGPAHPCQSAASYKEGMVDLPWYDKPVPAFVVTANRPNALSSNPPLRVICLHWDSASPVQAKGAYLSARFPPVHGIAVTSDGTALVTSDGAGDQASGKVTRVLDLADGTTADFAIQSVPLPKVSQGQSWRWVSRNLPQAVDLAAVNSSDLQRENNNAFYAGILFGIAGGALVALITELVQPFGRRKRAD
jgi:hypothetical protein